MNDMMKVFNIILGAAALKGALTTLAQPISREPLPRDEPVSREDDEGYDDIPDYEDLL